MTDWLDPLRAALEAAGRPVTFFFRDDDAGWEDDALARLLESFARHGLPVDVAAIPAVARRRTVTAIGASGADVAVHQHGFAHVSHEREGRKCEFGTSRSAGQQRADLVAGRALLADLFGALPAVFTPPWNRCASWTAGVLRDLDFQVLSRDLSAGRAGVPGLLELPVTVDWFAKRRKVPVDREGRGELLAESVGTDEPVGLMLHHAVMSEQDHTDLADLLALLAEHPGVRTGHLDTLATSAGSLG